jgi:hypothetical protein
VSGQTEEVTTRERKYEKKKKKKEGKSKVNDKINNIKMDNISIIY